jgi:hypothetical protein
MPVNYYLCEANIVYNPYALPNCISVLYYLWKLEMIWLYTVKKNSRKTQMYEFQLSNTYL